MSTSSGQNAEWGCAVPIALLRYHLQSPQIVFLEKGDIELVSLFLKRRMNMLTSGWDISRFFSR